MSLLSLVFVDSFSCFLVRRRSFLMVSYFSNETFLRRHGLQLIDIGGPSETEGLSPSTIENSQTSTVVNRTLRLNFSSSGETIVDSSFLVLGVEEISSDEIAMERNDSRTKSKASGRDIP